MGKNAIKTGILFVSLTFSLLGFAKEITLLNIRSNNDIRKNFTYAWGKGNTIKFDKKTVRNKLGSLKISSPTKVIKSKIFEYKGGEIKASCFMKFKNLKFHPMPRRITFLLQFYPVDGKGKNIGPHHDGIYITDPKDINWKKIEHKYIFPNKTKGFYFYIMVWKGALKSGDIWLNDLKISENVIDQPEKWEEQLSNHGFEINQGDHSEWSHTKGLDWDNISFGSKDPSLFSFSNGGRIGIKGDVRPGSKGNRCIVLTGNYTLATPFIPYNGEKMHFEGWQKFWLDPEARKKISNPVWKSVPTQVQILAYNAKKEKIQHMHRDMFYGSYNTAVNSKDWYKVSVDWEWPSHVKYVRVFIRVFPKWDGKCKIAYDDFSLKFLKSSAPSKPLDKKKALVKVNVSKELGKFDFKLGSHLHYNSWFHTTDVNDPLTDYYIQHGKMGFSWVRYGFSIPWSFISSWDEEGNPVCDFSGFDSAMDHLVKKCGLKLVFNITDMPRDLTPESYIKQYNCYKRRYSRSPPTDYDKYKQLLKVILNHVIERYGKDNLNQWILSLENEPCCTGGSYWGLLEDYLKQYDYFVAAVEEIEKEQNIKLKIAGCEGGWVRDFMKHCASGVNYYSKKKGSRCDYLNYHLYMGKTIPSVKVLQNTINTIRRAQKEFPALAKAPLINTEGNSIGHVTSVNNSSYLVGFFPALVRCYLDNNVNISIFHQVSGHPSNKNKFFLGYPMLYTLSGIPTAQSNALSLIMKMNAGTRVKAESSNNPIETLAAFDKKNNKLYVLTGNFDEDPLEKYKTEVTLKINWPMAKNKDVHVKTWEVSADNANAYTLWVKDDKPYEKGYDRTNADHKKYVHDLIERSKNRPLQVKTLRLKSKAISFVQPSHSMVLTEIQLPTAK